MTSKLATTLTLALAMLGASGCVIGPKPDDPLKVDSGVLGPPGDAGDFADTSTGFVTDASDEVGGAVPDAAAVDAARDGDAAADGDAALDGEAPGDSADATDGASDAPLDGDAAAVDDATVVDDGG